MSTLDERVGRKVRSRRASGPRKTTTSSRAAQGLPPKIEDAAVLEAAAGLVAATLIEMAEAGDGWTREGAGHARPA